MNHLLIRDFVRSPACYHFARLELGVRGGHAVHTSDFLEVFWIESGIGIHYINGAEHRLQPGDIWLIRPEDAHSVMAVPSGSVRFVNVAFPGEHWGRVREAYFAGLPDWFAEGGAYLLDGPERTQMAQVSLALESTERDQAPLDLLLIQLGLILKQKHQSTESDVAPAWLQEACRLISSPKHLRRGTSAFVELCDRSPDHVARSARRWLGKSPTEIVTAARLEYATYLLAQTATPIQHVAVEAGFSNLSHFYRLFTETHGVAPGAFRQKALRIAGNSQS